MNNKIGYAIGIISAVIYSYVIHGEYTILDLLASSLGALLIPAVIAGFIVVISKSKKHGQIFAITCVATFILIGFVNYGKV